MKRLTLPKLLRAIAILIFLMGAGLGYDAGDKPIMLGTQLTQMFDVWLALLIWFGAFALSVLFWAVARILELLDK